MNRAVYDSRVEKRRSRKREYSTKEERGRQKREMKGVDNEWQMTPVRRSAPDWADVHDVPAPAVPGTGKGTVLEADGKLLMFDP